jgi:hypothetical protein
MGLSRNAARRIQSTRRRTEAIKLREKGLSYKEIGERMGISEQRAWTLVSLAFDYLNQRLAEKASTVQRLEASRLDQMFKGVWTKARGGDFKAIAAVISIMERRARLLGLDLADNKQAAPQANVVLNVNEVIVEKREEISNGSGHGQAILPPPVATEVPAE